MAIDLNDDKVDEPVRYWLKQLEASHKDRQRWDEQGQLVINRYMEKDKADLPVVSRTSNSWAAHTMNVLWSNVETIRPALYAKTPTPKVQRRYRDKDPVGKWAAIVLERSCDFQFDAYDVDYHVRGCVEDYLLPGRGQVWIKYKPNFEKVNGQETLAWECTDTRHLNWKDFRHSPARTWDEVWWVAKREYLTKEQIDKDPTFTKGVSDKISFQEKREDDKQDGGDKVPKAEVWEIWCKSTGMVTFVSKDCPELLAKPTPPPLDLEGFYPCPRPLTTTTTTDSIIPRPDFVFYQNQADEIDRLTQRINLLTKALRVAGFYDASNEGLGTFFIDTTDNVMIPVESWAVFSQQGGLKGAVDFFPLDQVIKALTECYAAREQAKQSMYEVTGISDIVRGASEPSETATAQQIKTQWGSLRIRDRQAEVQRFVRDIVRIQSEIIAEHFQLETLKTMSNCPLLMQADKDQLLKRQQFAQQAAQMAQQNPQMAQQIAKANPQLAQMAKPLSPEEQQAVKEPTWEEVFALLRNQKLRSFRIDIETDSTVYADDMQEKADRTEFIGAMTSFAEAWGPMVQAMPKIAPLAGELMLFGARAFKQSDILESAIEEFVDSMTQLANNPQQQQKPDPKIMVEMQKAQMQDATAQKKIQVQAQTEIQKEEIKTEGKVREAAMQQPGDELMRLVQELAQRQTGLEQTLQSLVGNRAH